MFIIRIPESAEVTRKVINKTTMTTDRATASSGVRIRLIVLNNWAEMSSVGAGAGHLVVGHGAGAQSQLCKIFG